MTDRRLDAADATADDGGDLVDRVFIDMMVPHHQSAIEMARLAQERAEHDELRTLAAAIIAAQQREISLMRSWRSDWFGSDEVPAMNAGSNAQTMDMTADVEMVRHADPFDPAFIDAMIGHHQSAIDAAEAVLHRTKRPEIRALAENVIETQRREIDQLAGWDVAWYTGPR
jgi:uncharacterized protein (DUF305 family)